MRGVDLNTRHVPKDTKEDEYSAAYDAAVAGDPAPSTIRLDAEHRAASEFGYDQGRRNHELITQTFRSDPSAEYHIREYHRRKKWDFAAVDAKATEMIARDEL